MFGLFPCSWKIPGSKPVHNLADHHFPPKTLKISAPVPAPMKATVKHVFPECELLRPGEDVDLTQIDELLADLYDDSQDAKARRMTQVIAMVNDNLKKNIQAIENEPALGNSNVSNADILKLLKLFANYSRNLENYIKEIRHSSSSFSQY